MKTEQSKRVAASVNGQEFALKMAGIAACCLEFELPVHRSGSSARGCPNDFFVFIVFVV